MRAVAGLMFLVVLGASSAWAQYAPLPYAPAPAAPAPAPPPPPPPEDSASPPEPQRRAVGSQSPIQTESAPERAQEGYTPPQDDEGDSDPPPPPTGGSQNNTDRPRPN